MSLLSASPILPSNPPQISLVADISVSTEKFKMSQNKSPDQFFFSPPETIKLIIWAATATGYNGWNKDVILSSTITACRSMSERSRGQFLVLVDKGADNWGQTCQLENRIKRVRSPREVFCSSPVWPSELWQGRKVKRVHVY